MAVLFGEKLLAVLSDKLITVSNTMFRWRFIVLGMTGSTNSGDVGANHGGIMTCLACKDRCQWE